MTPAPTLHDLITAVRDDAPSDDPLEQLAVAVVLAAEIDSTKDELLGYFVDRCRGGGKSWSEISGALGVTRQAAHRRFNVSDPPLDRFTARARHVVERAPEEARALDHDFVGTEHLLLALFTEAQSLAAQILRERGVARTAVEAAVLVVSPRGTATLAGSIPYNPRVVTALTGAVTSAIELGHNYVGTEHILLALLRDQDALAAKILGAHGMQLDDTRQRVVDALAVLTSAPSQALDWTQLLAAGVIVDGFDRFTDAAHDIVVRAQEDARSLQQAYLGTEHLLLGCFGDDSSRAAEILGELGLTKPRVRDEVVRIVGVGPRPVEGNIPFTARSRARLERALVEAGQLHADRVAPEHVLLALVQGDDPGFAAQILEPSGGTYDRVLELVRGTAS